MVGAADVQLTRSLTNFVTVKGTKQYFYVYFSNVNVLNTNDQISELHLHSELGEASVGATIQYVAISKLIIATHRHLPTQT